MTIATYFLIVIVLFLTLSVWYKRSHKNKNSIWHAYLDLDNDADDALVLISFCSLLWPISIPIGFILICLVIGVRAWHRWMDK